MTILLHTVDEVASTNDVARAALLSGVPAGSVYRAERQTGGRGRRGKEWLSQPGDLMMSAVLRPALEPGTIPMVTLAAAVAAQQALANVGMDCHLRWPNDLIVGGRKLGGILVEGVLEGEQVRGCVVGVGINVGLDVDGLEAPLRDTSTSFRHLGRPAPDLDALSTELTRLLMARVAALEAGDSAALLAAWEAQNVTLGEPVEYEVEGRTDRGRAVALSPSGALLVDREGGGRVAVTSGEVRGLTGGHPDTESRQRRAPAGDLLLVFDVGNTNTVAGAFRGRELLAHWRMQTHRDLSGDEHGIRIRQLLDVDGLKTADIGHVILSCVVPPMLSPLEDMVRRFFGMAAIVVGPGIKTGMPILYENPREVGADRVVNAVAAYDRHAAGLICVDFGTATTFDAVSPNGEYLGGVIAPGMAISADALFRHAARLPRVDFSRPDRVVGRNTVASMQAGLLFGYVGLVKEIVLRMKAELDFPTRVFATGGLARFIGEEAAIFDEIDEHLTLAGLRILFERNRDAAG